MVKAAPEDAFAAVTAAFGRYHTIRLDRVGWHGFGLPTAAAAAQADSWSAVVEAAGGEAPLRVALARLLELARVSLPKVADALAASLAEVLRRFGPGPLRGLVDGLAGLAVGETGIPPHPPLPLVAVSTVVERARSQK